MNTSLNPPSLLFRYERKFRVSDISMATIEHIIRMHPAGFFEVYPVRNVNNIYFDTNNLQTFLDNVDGVANRTKFRIRWYGELFGPVEKPVMEFKIKKNLVGRKINYPLKSFMLKAGVTSQKIKEAIDHSNMPAFHKLKVLRLRPLLLNRYTRKYFLSSDGKYRLTLDFNLYYYRIQDNNNSFMHRIVDRQTSIVELKYPQELDEDAHKIGKYFPFRMTKNSKYVTGIQNLYR